MDIDAENIAFLHELLIHERHGVLCTAHARLGGWPFGSLAPFALTARHEPVFLFSAIAEHTHNLAADARASLLVQDHRSQERPLEGARVTLMGSAEMLQGRARRDGLDCYLGRFPEAEAWASAHDFSPFLLRVERVRWIRGFGSMGWIERSHW